MVTALLVTALLVSNSYTIVLHVHVHVYYTIYIILYNISNNDNAYYSQYEKIKDDIHDWAGGILKFFVTVHTYMIYA